MNLNDVNTHVNPGIEPSCSTSAGVNDLIADSPTDISSKPKGLSPVDALRLIRRILCNKELNAQTRLVGAFVVLVADNNSATARVGYRRIRKELGVSNDTIAKALERHTGSLIRDYFDVLESSRAACARYQVSDGVERSMPRSAPADGAPALHTTEHKRSTGRSNSSPLSNPTNKESLFSEIVDYWNSQPNRPNVKKLTQGRRQKLCARCRDPDFLKRWREVIDRVEASDFCNGHSVKRWIANFDWFISNDTNWVKVLDGNYDTSNKRKTNNGSGDRAGQEETADPNTKYRKLL